MKINPALIALVALTLSLPALADTFKLKDGSQVEGETVKETEDSYLVEIQISRSIKDEREIRKADVASVVRKQLDIKAYEEISGLLPTPDFLTDEEYGKRIIAVQKFIKDFPDSAKSADAKSMLVTLKEESTQVASGGIKINGGIVTPTDYKLNAYDLDSRVQAAKVREYANQGQLLAALRTYAEFCSDFEATTANLGLIPLILEVIQTHVDGTKLALATFDERAKKRMSGLEQMAPEDRRLSENAIKEEVALSEAQLKAEKESKQIWVTPNPFNKASLEETVKTGESEIKRLSTASNVVGRDAGKAWRDALATIHNSKNPAAISTALATAKSAGVSAKYIAMLESAARSSN